MEVVVITGAISRAKLQSNHHHQQTNIQFFLQAGCPFCRPTNSVKALKGKISHSMDLLTPSSPGGLPALSLTIISSWLPWGRVAMPLTSPLMPVPQIPNNYCFQLCDTGSTGSLLQSSSGDVACIPMVSALLTIHAM